jgi:hypothetical protein
VSASDTKFERWAAAAGIVFVVLFVAGFVVFGGPSTNAKWAGWYSDGGHRASAIVGAYLSAFAILAFLWFVAGLRHRLTQAGASQALLGLASAAAVVFAVLALASIAARANIPGGKEFGNEALPSGRDLPEQLNGLGFALLLLPGALALSVFTGTVTAACRQVAALPGWLTVAGYVVAVALLAGVLFFPVVLFLLWTLIASIVLIRHGRAATAT